MKVQPNAPRVIYFRTQSVLPVSHSVWRYGYQLQVLLILQLGPLNDVSGLASSSAGGEARAKTSNTCVIRTAAEKELADEVAISYATKFPFRVPDFAGGVSEDSPPKL